MRPNPSGDRERMLRSLDRTRETLDRLKDDDIEAEARKAVANGWRPSHNPTVPMERKARASYRDWVEANRPAPSGWRIAADLFLVVGVVYLSVRLFIPAIARLF